MIARGAARGDAEGDDTEFAPSLIDTVASGVRRNAATASRKAGQRCAARLLSHTGSHIAALSRRYELEDVDGGVHSGNARRGGRGASCVAPHRELLLRQRINVLRMAVSRVGCRPLHRCEEGRGLLLLAIGRVLGLGAAERIAHPVAPSGGARGFVGQSAAVANKTALIRVVKVRVQAAVRLRAAVRVDRSMAYLRPSQERSARTLTCSRPEV